MRPRGSVQEPKMKKVVNYFAAVAGIIVLFLLAYFFYDLFICFLVAAVLSLLGRPITNLFKKIHIKKWYVPDGLAAALTLISFGLILTLVILLIGPMISSQAAMFRDIKTNDVIEYFKGPLAEIHSFLVTYGVIPAEEDLTAMLTHSLNKILDFASLGSFFGGMVSTASSLVVNIFTVLFLLFFLLRDQPIIRNIIMAVVPKSAEDKTKTIISETRVLMTRYFCGLLTELVSMMVILSVLLSIMGIKNAILIGFLGGFLNVIPYLGPVIGCVLGCVLGVISTLNIQDYGMLLPNVLIIIGCFVAANAVDNFLLQPIIYSKSVKAHPIEIFLVILMAAKIGGVFGMIIALPTYSLIRIVAKQFLGKLKFVDALVKDMKFSSTPEATNDDGAETDS